MGDSTITVYTDASGMALFRKLKAGYVAVNITLANYSEVHYVASLAAGAPPGGAKISNLIPMIPIAGTSTGTISGQITFESDLTNLTKEPASGVTVVALVDANSDALDNIKTGNIQSFTYGDLNLTTTTDASGNYSLTVPATANGLDYELRVLDFQVDQTLLIPTVDGVENSDTAIISTLFGSSFTDASDLKDVCAAYITFEAPNKVFAAAAATATIDGSLGVESVNVTSPGEEYNVVPSSYQTYIHVSGMDISDYAYITVHLDGTYGRIQYIAVNASAGGSGHSTSSTINLDKMIVGNITTVDGSGAITGINMSCPNIYDEPLNTDPGDPDWHVPNTIQDDGDVEFLSDNGQDAELDPLFVNLGKVSGDICEFQFTGFDPATIDSGQDYAVNDLIVFPLNPTTSASAIPNIAPNGVSAISVTNPGEGYVSGNVTVLVEEGGGSGVTTSVSVVNGKIAYIDVTDPGSGYTSAPTVSIINELLPEQAPIVYVAADDDGKLLNEYYVLDGTELDDIPATIGSGYVTHVDATLTPSVTGIGTGASIAVEVNASGEISNIIITNQGTGYNGKNTPEEEVDPDEVEVTVKGSGSAIRNIYLGTGLRTIEE